MSQDVVSGRRARLNRDQAEKAAKALHSYQFSLRRGEEDRSPACLRAALADFLVDALHLCEAVGYQLDLEEFLSDVKDQHRIETEAPSGG